MNKYTMPEIEKTKELTNNFFDKYIELKKMNQELEKMNQALERIIEWLVEDDS